MPKSAIAYLGGVFGTAASAASGAAAAAFSRTDTASVAAATGNSADTGSGTANGVRLSVNLTALSGTTPTIAFALYDSADNSTFAPVAGMTITAMSAAGQASVSIDGGAPVRRYVAVATTVTGTTPSATFTATVDKSRVSFTPHQNPDHTAVKDTRT